jgi:hypothetical protein
MEKPSPAYLLAQGLYNRLNTERLGENFTQNIPGHRIICTGEVNGQPAVQTLNLAKNGIYYFSTTFGYAGGRTQTEPITPQSEPYLINPLLSSLHMEVLATIALQQTITAE